MVTATSLTVRSGDTLSALAERHGVSTEALMRANGMDPALADGRVTRNAADPDRLMPGQQLRIPSATPGYETSHTVRSGDTLSGIAERWNVSLKDLLAANPNVTNPDVISPGEVLRVPADRPASSTSVGRPATAGRPGAPTASATRPAPAALPSTQGLNEAQRFDLYAGQVRQFGDGGARSDLAAGRRVILSLRNDTNTRVQQGRGQYDDRMVVLWQGADGSKHAVELRANTEPSGQYEDGGPFTRRAVGGNYGGDSRGDQGRLADGTYLFVRGHFQGAVALMAGNDQVTQRDTNHNGRFDDGVTTPRGGYGMHIHVGGQSNTYSAGCLTLPPSEHARLFETLGSQNSVRNVLVNTSQLTAEAPATAAAAQSNAPATRGLTEADWQRAASQLGVDVAAVKAVAEVEAPRTGFLADGRPRILFEAHQFSDRTAGQYDGSHPNISSPQWNRDLYRGGAAEYTRLSEAMALDGDAALKSASWGRFQIMGFNHQAAGYANVRDFVAAMQQGEGRQLDAFVSFIQADPGMHRALARHDWAGFAQAYNGPGYAANQYDTRMAEAHARFSR